MLGWQRRPPFADRVEIDGREAVVTPTPVLRPGGPPCPRLSRSAGCASSPIRPPSTPLRGRRRRDGRRPAVRAGRGVRDRRDAASTLDDAHAIVEAEAGFVGAWLDRSTVIARHTRVAAPGRATGPRPGLDRRRAGQGSGCPTTATALLVAAAAYADELAERLGWRDERSYTRDAACRSAGRTSRRPRYDVVIIGGGGHGLSTAYYLATRHGITNVAVLEADYIASRQHRPEHDDHPRQLRHPRGDPLLPALARAVPGARGRDRRRRSSTRPRASSGCAHTEMAMRTERARGAMNQALRRETVHGHARPSSRSSSRRST